MLLFSLDTILLSHSLVTLNTPLLVRGCIKNLLGSNVCLARRLAQMRAGWSDFEERFDPFFVGDFNSFGALQYYQLFESWTLVHALGPLHVPLGPWPPEAKMELGAAGYAAAGAAAAGGVGVGLFGYNRGNYMMDQKHLGLSRT